MVHAAQERDLPPLPGAPPALSGPELCPFEKDTIGLSRFWGRDTKTANPESPARTNAE